MPSKQQELFSLHDLHTEEITIIDARCILISPYTQHSTGYKPNNIECLVTRYFIWSIINTGITCHTDDKYMNPNSHAVTTQNAATLKYDD